MNIRQLTIMAQVLLVWMVGACSAAVEASGLGGGVWLGQVGTASLAIAFLGDPTPDRALIHILRDGRKTSEMPSHELAGEGGFFSFLTSTGVRIEGEADLQAGTAAARLLYGNAPPTSFALVRRNPAGVRGLAARAPGTSLCSPVVDRGDGWRTAMPAEVGLDPAAVTAAVGAIAAGQAGVIHSLLVARGGRLCVEEYFHGGSSQDRHRLASVTKGVSSLLVGIAVDAGEIPSVEAPLTGLLPDLAAGLKGDKADLTLRHVLTMSMGLKWSEQEAGRTHGTGDRFFREILGRPLADPPGRVWQYVSANVDLLSGILRRACGSGPEDLARERLFGPLQIADWDWSFGAEGQDRLMDGSLQLIPRDMLKFGQLLLDEGRWQGRQVVSAEWVAASTARQIQTSGPEGYGYLWWLMALPSPDGPVPCVVANGHGSQFIAVFPAQDLVVATTGGNEDNGKHFAVARVLGQVLLPGAGPVP